MKRVLAAAALAASALLVFCLPPAEGSGCRAVVVKKQTVYHAPVVHHEVYHEQVVPIVAAFVPVAVPVYGAYYTPPVREAAPEDLAAAVKALAAEVRALKGGAGPAMPPADGTPGTPAKPSDPFAPQQQSKADPLSALVSKHCASCHSDADTKGGFAWVKGGKLLDLTGEQLGSVVEQVASKKMPQKSTMTETERLEMLRLLVTK